MDLIEQHASFGGTQSVYQHASRVLGCDMKFAVFVPSHEDGARLPVIYWLSGLTCTEQNFNHQGGRATLCG